MNPTNNLQLISLLEYVKENPYSALFYTPPIYDDALCFFFKKPGLILTANNLNELNALFDKAETYINKDYTGYIYAKYEAAYMLEPYFSNIEPDSSDFPLIKLCLFDKDNTELINSKDISFAGIENAFHTQQQSVTDFKLNSTKQEFVAAINKIKKYIARGDTYQVNYTLKSAFNFKGDISSLFLNLIFMQSGRYTSFINDDENYILSMSPELFFERSRNKVICMPMKGTENRGYDMLRDIEGMNSLKTALKNRAENVMIVDLMRNDLSRMHDVLSVKCKSVFDTEKYETLHQMTSTIEATFKREVKLREIFDALFPCGSITGAPKIRTMEIIRELEKEKRGIYTGALGIISKERDVFNVPIRTMLINRNTGNGEMGIGSGIVWDSVAEDEYDETVLKSSFLTKPVKYFELIETMLVENNKLFLLDQHIERLRQAADFFLFKFDEEYIRISIQKSLNELNTNFQIFKFSNFQIVVRLVLNKWGECKCETRSITNSPSAYKIAISDFKLSAEDKFLYFKTTNRKLYDDEYSKYSEQGFDEVVFFNNRGELTEGSRTNIFIRKNDKWYTPQLSCGLLNGLYRQYFIDNNPSCIETTLYYDDLLKADEIKLTNSVRKEVKGIL